ncbi:hypothetical protein HYPSUDRAFT_38973 [Hypholoma sublateritium FD-334 SS-4]|uniref:Nitronate monooxygenase domain-containing protein n=1 Tax=Hypholoma sublateritium (strain FD-334 SS-4) TaxID=945553 RepID=A0A0D2P6G3_HYPSF|nr:hypothetical protein HYPSUDRAFT_38973 [Hypholoma sublateritium FD-334 SS-4]
MAPINTTLTKLLNIDVPIVAAPMTFAGTSILASAVTAVGAFGFLAAGFFSSAELKKQFAHVRETLKVAPGTPVPVGIGFIGWILDITEPSPDPRLVSVLDEKPAAIWLAFGVDLGKYVAQIRKYDEGREYKTVIFVIVSSVETARRAAEEWGVDVLVAQGIEAGGHGASDAPPLLTLLAAIRAALPTGPPIVAAGGITTGAQIAALLALGAAGAALGTRFLFTPECIYSPPMKAALVRAGLGSTVRTLAYDEVGRTNMWPPACDGRALRNSVMDDVEAGLGLEERLVRFDASKAAGEEDRLIVWAGVGVGLVNEITPAGDVVRALHKETVESLHAAAKLLEA